MGNKQQPLKCYSCLKVQSQNKLKYQSCPKCNQIFCSECNSNPIVTSEDAQKFIKNSDITPTIMCLNCFKNTSTIDFNSEVDIIGPENKRTLLWAHGALSCRKMFRVHAAMLAEYGYRSILLDLPGHGTQMNTSLTIEDCVQHIYKIRKQYCSADNPPVAIGGSLGGYMLMQTIRKYPKTSDFAGIVIGMASQNVGHGRSWKASLGLFMIGSSTKILSNQSMAKYFLTMAKNVDRKVIIEYGECGMFFNQPQRRVQLLKQTQSIKGVQAYEGPLLFLNGENDHKDSLQLWSSSTKVPSQSKIYKGSDHFFSHDRKYIKQFADDIRKFADQVFQSTKQIEKKL